MAKFSLRSLWKRFGKDKAQKKPEQDLQTWKYFFYNNRMLDDPQKAREHHEHIKKGFQEGRLKLAQGNDPVTVGFSIDHSKATAEEKKALSYFNSQSLTVPQYTQEFLQWIRLHQIENHVPKEPEQFRTALQIAMAAFAVGHCRLSQKGNLIVTKAITETEKSNIKYITNKLAQRK